MDQECTPSPHRLLIVQNSSNTEWFVANDAHIYCNDAGTWFVNAKRMPVSEHDIPLNMVTWTMTTNVVSLAKTIAWVSSPTCAVHKSTKNNRVDSILTLSDIIRVELCTLTSSNVGQLNEYTIHLINDKDHTGIRVYSWMTTFVDAWNSGDLYLGIRV